MSSTGRRDEVGWLGVGGENGPSPLSVLEAVAGDEGPDVGSGSAESSVSKMEVEVDELINFGGLLASNIGTSSTMTGRPSFGSQVVAVAKATEEDVHQAGVMMDGVRGVEGPCASVTVDEVKVKYQATWTQVNDPPAIGYVHPEPRHRAVSYGDLMIVFGGGPPAPDNKGKVHVFDTSKNLWFQPQLSGDIPCERAAFGMAVDGSRILVHGGIMGDARFGDDLYQLSLTNWEWRKLNPVGLDLDVGILPCGRRGHSFTFLDGKVYLFGGLTVGGGYFGSQPSQLLLNDLYILHVHLHNEEGGWTQPATYGRPPNPRQSHTAVAYTSHYGGYKKLIVYGGTGKGGQLRDVHFFDLASSSWTKPQLRGSPPSPICCHTATMIGDKMYVFGGMNSWLEEVEGEMKEQWSCNNALACLDVDRVNWEHPDSLEEFVNGESPPPRAGHSAVLINNGIYIFSGNSVKTVAGRQVCFSDLWKLKFPGPQAGDLGSEHLEGITIGGNAAPNTVGDIDILLHDKIGDAEAIAPRPCDVLVEGKEDLS